MDDQLPTDGTQPNSARTPSHAQPQPQTSSTADRQPQQPAQPQANQQPMPPYQQTHPQYQQTAPQYQQPMPGRPGVPGQPGTPLMQGQPYGQPMPQSAAKKPATGLIVGIVTAVIAVIVVLAVVVTMIMSKRITAADYTAGENQVLTMQKHYASVNEKLRDAYLSAYGSSSFQDTDKKRLKDRLKTLQNDNAKFESLKVMNDETVNKEYQAYKKKTATYIKFVDEMIESGESLSKAAKACNSSPSVSSYDNSFYTKYGEYVSACKAALDDVSKSPNKDIAQYGKDLGDYVDKLGDIISSMQAIGDISSLQYGTTQYQQFRDLLDEFNNLEAPYSSVSTLSQALQDSAEEADLSDSLRSLYDALTDGADHAH